MYSGVWCMFNDQHKPTRPWPCSSSATSLRLEWWEWIWTPAWERQVRRTASAAPWTSHHGVVCQPFPPVCEVVIPADLLRSRNLFPSCLFEWAVCSDQENNLPLGSDHRLFFCCNREGWVFCLKRKTEQNTKAGTFLTPFFALSKPLGFKYSVCLDNLLFLWRILLLPLCSDCDVPILPPVSWLGSLRVLLMCLCFWEGSSPSDGGLGKSTDSVLPPICVKSW